MDMSASRNITIKVGICRASSWGWFIARQHYLGTDSEVPRKCKTYRFYWFYQWWIKQRGKKHLQPKHLRYPNLKQQQWFNCMILRLAAYLTGTWKMRGNPRPLFIFPSSTTRPELPNRCTSSSCKVLAAAASNPWTSLQLNTLGPENVFVDWIYMALVGFQGKFGGVRNMWPSGGLTPKVLTVMPHVLVYFQIFTLRPEHALLASQARILSFQT